MARKYCVIDIANVGVRVLTVRRSRAALDIEPKVRGLSGQGKFCD